MAQSLLCKDCGVQLLSVKEAQDHADATGHANFEESTEATLRSKCADCGKVCRSQTEQDLHTKYTGHTQFVEQTTETKGLDTEAQMAEARGKAREEDGSGVGEPPQAPTTDQTTLSEELIPAEVDEALLSQLLDMGFGRNRAIRAIYSSGGESVDAAVAWLTEHEDDVDMDDPLMVPKSSAKKKLSPEEAKAQALELMRRAKEKREAEERDRERQRELERIRMGKELAAIARLEEEARLRRIAEERQREKEEEDRARQKIRKKLEEDRKERRKKLGLPEELNEEEKEGELRREREKAELEARRRLPVKPVAKAERMRMLLVNMKKSYPGRDQELRTAWQTLLKFVTNVGSNPGEEKFRKIRLTNPAVQSRVLIFDGTLEFLEICGFAKDASGEAVEMAREGVDLPLLEAAVENLNSALSNPFFGVL